MRVHDVQHIEKAEHIANSNHMTGDVLIYDDFIHRYFVSSFICKTCKQWQYSLIKETNLQHFTMTTFTWTSVI